MPKIKITLFLLGSVAFSAFIAFSYLVNRQKFVTIDHTITVKIQENLPSIVDYPFSTLSLIGSIQVTMVIWTILLLYLLVKRHWLAALSMFLLPIALVVEVYGKQKIYHPAPPQYLYKGVFSLETPCHPIRPDSPYFCFYVQSDYAYPSGHVMRTAFLVFFASIYFYLRHNQFVQSAIIPSLGGLLLLMLISRVYLGEHWTTDVIGGLLLGSSLAFIAGLTIPEKKSIHQPTIEHN